MLYYTKLYYTIGFPQGTGLSGSAERVPLPLHGLAPGSRPVESGIS